MSVSRVLFVILLAGAASLNWAGTASEIEQLGAKVAALEQKLEEQQAAYQKMLEEQFAALSKQLDAKFTALEKKLAETGRNDAEREQRANAVLAQVNRAVNDGNFDEAKTKMGELQKSYAGTQAARRAGKLRAELSVIGKETPASLGIEKWYQGEGDVDPANGQTTLLVFWEVWCSHCKREVPKLQELYTKYKDDGLQVLGLTKITRSATEEKVRAFLIEQNVGYPMAKENGDASSYFNVSGIPAAAVVKDGKVVWRGHPARLSEEMLQGWM